MPDETHRYLVQYETAGADQVAAGSDRITESLRRQREAQERLTTVGRMDISGLPVAGRIERETEALRQFAETRQRLLTDPTTQAGPSFREQAEDAMGKGPATGRAKLAERLETIGADVEFTAEAFRAYDEAVAAHIPTEKAVSQAISETATTFRTLQQSIEPTLSWTEKMTSGLEGMGANQEFATQAMERFQALVDQGVPAQTAMSQAVRETNKAIQDTGEVAQKSGNWLGSYIRRYLVRYLVVWQAMRVVQDVMGDISKAQREMRETTFLLGTAMRGTGQEAQQYLGTLSALASQTTAAPSAIAGGMLLGEGVGTMVTQLAEATGAAPQKWMQHLAMLRDDYGLTADAIEGMLDRMVVAYARHALLGKDYFGDFQEALRDTVAEVGALADAIERMPAPSIKDQFGRLLQIGALTRHQQQLFAQRPYEEQLELGREFAREQGLPGREQQAGINVSSFPGFFGWLAGQPRPEPTMTAHEQFRLTGVSPSEEQAQLGIKGFGGKMTGAEAERYEDLIQKWDAYFLEQGRYLEKQTITLVTEIGQPLKMIVGSAEASKMALEEMNERQKTAVYNWPGNVAMIAMGVGAATSRTTAIRRGPAAPPYTPLGGGAPYIPGANPSWNAFDIFAPSYQHGGVVQETGPAIVHKGETITPEGQSPINYLRLQSDIYMDGNHVAQSVSTRLGDQLYQAQRAAGG